MTDQLTEGPRDVGFILSEANGARSRENGIVKTGQVLAPGTVVMLDGTGDLVAQDGTLTTAGDLVTPSAGVLLYGIDTSATGFNADTEGAYFARDGEVNGNLLVFPTETTAGGERAATVASLAALGIIVRDEIPAA